MIPIVSLLLLHLTLGVPHHQGNGYPQYHAPALAQQLQTPQVVCLTQYETVWDTSYNQILTQVCHKHNKKVCKVDHTEVCLDTYKTECHRELDRKCHTSYRKVCVEQLRTEYEHFIETECTTLNKEHCEHRWEGEGNDKVWVVIPGTCVSNPYDVCKDIPKTKEKQIPFPVCNDVPYEECINVPKDVCKDVPDKVCKTTPFETCETVPEEECEREARRVPVRFSRKIPKQVCDHSYQNVDVPTIPYDPQASLGLPIPSVPINTQSNQVNLTAVPAVPEATTKQTNATDDLTI